MLRNIRSFLRRAYITNCLRYNKFIWYLEVILFAFSDETLTICWQIFTILQIESTWCTIFLNMFIVFLYVFRATMCPSSGEIIVPMRHLVFVTLYGWLSGMQDGIHSALHTRQSSKYRAKNTRCRISTVISPDDGHIVARNM
jgi:hypothetical protein